MVTATLYLIDDASSLKRKINKELVKEINKSIQFNFNGYIGLVKTGTKDFFEESVGYQELINGDLDGHFGFYPGEGKSRADAIINRVIESMEITYVPFGIRGESYTGGITIKVIKSDFIDILSLTEAFVYNKNTGEDLPWLDWTLKLGEQIIITNHHVAFNISSKQKELSRSGKALMFKNGYWKVPSVISGTSGDNWLTRSLLGGDGTGNKYFRFLEKLTRSLFNR